MTISRIPEIVVPDTSFAMSALLFPSSWPAIALALAMRSDILITSRECLAELTEVLARPKFDRFLSAEKRMAVLLDYRACLRMVETTHQVSVCRDPSDNKFLALALSGNADVIVTGDADLLVLHPFQGIDIVSSRDYVNR